MKITKRMRKKIKGMNAATKAALENGFEPPRYNGSEPVMVGYDLIPPYAKMSKGVPYVNQFNF